MRPLYPDEFDVSIANRIRAHRIRDPRLTAPGGVAILLGMARIAAEDQTWIQAPTEDLSYFSFGWLLVFIPLFVTPSLTPAVILVVLLFNYVHRHYTFVLIYGEPEEFARHRQAYVLLPLIALAVTFLSVALNAFPLLLTISVLWTILHSVAQKYGLTRVYARKAGYGDRWIEKGVIYSWFYVAFFGVAESERGALAEYTSGQVILSYVGAHLDWMTLASHVALLVALGFTALYLRQEWRHRVRISIAKNLYVGSILLLYAVFFYSLVVGYIVFAFSHALEYIAFVNLFVAQKYRKRPGVTSFLARAVRRQRLTSATFAGLVIGLSLIARAYDEDAFAVYIAGSSFLHFIYDAMIWKVRRPEVGEPLGIRYTPA